VEDLFARYRAVWERTVSQRALTAESVSESRFFFDFPVDGKPTPRRFDTYAIVCGLPYPGTLQRTLKAQWEQCISSLGNPLAYAVLPPDLHTEIFLFQRPGETFSAEEVEASIQSSLSIPENISSFQLTLHHPFITPDGTVVVPGVDSPGGTIDTLRDALRSEVKVYPQKQSQWMHISLGRILEPLSEQRLAPLLNEMTAHWREVIGETTVGELLWTWGKQWYMLDREILHRRSLK